MKICYQCTELTENNAIGNIVVNLTEKFIKKNTIVIITGGYDENNQRIKHLISLGMKIYTIRHPRLPPSLGMIHLNRKITQKTKELDKTYDFDVIHCMNAGNYSDIFHAESSHAAWIDDMKKKRGLIYSMAVKIHPLTRATLRHDNKIIHNPRLKKIIACSNQVKKDIKKFHGIDERKITIIYNGIDKMAFLAADKKKLSIRKNIRSRHGIKNETVLLFVGNAFEKKGLGKIIKSLNGMGDIKLLVIGSDDPKPFYDLADSSGVADKIIFIGHSDEVMKYYYASDIFVFPTHHEPFGMVITEAMAAGLPVITTRESGAAEIMKNNSDGILISENDDYSILGEKIKLLVNDKKMRSKIGREARKTAFKTDWKIISGQVMNVYREIL